MKKSIVFAALMLCGMTQQVCAQSWLEKLGKGLDAVSNALSGGNNDGNNAADNEPKADESSITTASGTATVRTVHETAATKTMVLDGGVKWLRSFSCGRAVVCWKKGWFVIDKQGNKVFDLPLGYELPGYEVNYIGDVSGYDNDYDSNRLLVYSKSKKHVIIFDENGNMVKEFSDVAQASTFLNGVAFIMKKEKKAGSWSDDEVWYHIDVNGNVLSNTMSVSKSTSRDFRLYPTKEGLSPVFVIRDNHGWWGYRDEKCQWAIQPDFSGFGANDGGAFYNGLSRAMNTDNKWGFIDHNGQWVIQPMYTNRPGNFYTGVALVTDKSKRSYFIDKTGKFVWSEPQPSNVRIDEFMTTGYAIWKYYDDGFYLVDSSFKKHAKLNFGINRVRTYNDRYFQCNVDYDGEDRLVDWNGNVLLKGYADAPFTDGMCYHSNYYFNEQGEIVIKFEDTQF